MNNLQAITAADILAAIAQLNRAGIGVYENHVGPGYVLAAYDGTSRETCASAYDLIIRAGTSTTQD